MLIDEESKTDDIQSLQKSDDDQMRQQRLQSVHLVENSDKQACVEHDNKGVQNRGVKHHSISSGTYDYK